jgi:hypothetical protein
LLVPDSFGGIELEDEFGGVAVEEEFTPPEREDYVPPPPPAPVFGEGPEDIPPGMSAGPPPRLSDSEWDALRKNIALREEGTQLALEGEALAGAEKAIDRTQAGIISPSVVEQALMVGAPALNTLPGVRKAVAEGGSGLTSPLNLGLAVGAGGASLIPRIGGAVARGIAGGFAADIAGHMPELGTVAGEASVTGTPEEQQKALADIGVSALMGGLAGGGAVARARPAIPPRIVEAIAKADAVGLTKSAQAVADTVKREQPIDIASKVEPISDRPQQLEAPIEKGIPEAEWETAEVGRFKNEADAERFMEQNINNRFYRKVGDEYVVLEDKPVTTKGEPSASRIESAATPDGDLRASPVESQPAVPVAESGAGVLPREAPAVARQPARAQGGEEGQVLLTGPEVIKSIETLSDAEAGTLKQKPAVEAGLKLTEADVPALEAARDAAMQRAVDFAEAGNNEAFKANFGRNIWFSGAIEGARRKGPNYDTFIQEQKAGTPGAQPAPVEPARVGAVPEKLPAAEAGTPSYGQKYVSEQGVDAARARVEHLDLRVQEELTKRPVNTRGIENLIDEADNIRKALPAPPETLPPEPAAGRPAVAGAEVPAPALEPTYAATAKVVADKLREQFKTETGGKAFTGPVEIINAAVEVAAKIIEYGGSSADAMAAALKHIRDNWKGEFDEADFRTKFTKAIEVPDTRGETVKMRKSAERAVESPMVPEPVQERIEAAPESRYTQQSMARVEQEIGAMTPEQLAAVPRDSNLYTAARLEQAKRLFEAGKNDEGYSVFVELEKEGTRLGQLINQFKLLEGTRPEEIVAVINKGLERAKKDILTPEQTREAMDVASKAKEADGALDTATDAWVKNPTAENARRAEAALDKSNAEAVELQKFVAKFQPRSTSGILKSVLQGNLLTPISEVANLFGNMSFLPFRAMDRGIAAGIDMIDAAARGRPREVAVQPLVGTAEALKGVGRGLKKVPDILIEGTGNVIKGETRAGLHPIQAWINQFAKNPDMPTTGGKITLQDRLNLAIEGTFGVPAEAMLRGLGAGDVPFKEAARARTTAEQLRLNNVPREQWPFAQKFPELFLPKEALEQIRLDTQAAVFQRESKALNTINHLIRDNFVTRKLGVPPDLMDLLVSTVAPYRLTPWNIVGEVLSYNPLVAMARGVAEAKAGNTRAAKLNAGKMVVGSMLTGTGIWLYKNGLIAPSMDERDEAQKARVLAGEVLPPNHLNLSGIGRKLTGGNPAFKAGDETADTFRAGGLAGSIFYMTANIGRDMERGPKTTDSELWISILRQSTLEQARFGLNQSFLSGVEGMLTAIKDGNADTYLRQWANTVASIPLPNTLNTISRASREYKPDVSKNFPAQIKSKLGAFGLDDYLPLKRDFWGEPMRETPEGRDAIFYHFFDISKNKQVTSDPVELELYRLWRKTSNTEVIPSLPSRSLTLDKTTYALDPNQYERYAELVGKNRRTIVDALVINPNFHKLNDEQKIDVLDNAYREGLKRGKELFYVEQRGQLTPKTGRAGFAAE